MKSFSVQSVICRRRKQERRHQKWKESKWCTVPGPGQWAEFQSKERTAHTQIADTDKDSTGDSLLQQLRVSNHCQAVRYGGIRRSGHGPQFVTTTAHTDTDDGAARRPESSLSPPGLPGKKVSATTSRYSPRRHSGPATRCAVSVPSLTLAVHLLDYTPSRW